MRGGYRLARAPEEINLADIFRAVQGPLMTVHNLRPDAVAYTGAATPLQNVWIAVRANLRAVLEAVTLADVVGGQLPPRSRRSDVAPGRLVAPLTPPLRAGSQLNVAIPDWRDTVRRQRQLDDRPRPRTHEPRPAADRRAAPHAAPGRAPAPA